jgi:heme exporter protein C
MAQASSVVSGSSPKGRRSRAVMDVLLVASAVLMAITLYLVFFWVPTEATLGVSQRILYFHVPLGLLGMISIVIVTFASVMYLWKKDKKWDDLAHTSAEFGVIFATLIIVTGAIWSKPTFGVWWTWDPKLTTTLILWFIYVAYLMLRAYGPQGVQQARYAAVIALMGAVDSFIIYISTWLWRTAHPEILVGPLAESDSLESRMATTLLIAMATFTVLFVYILMERYSLKRSESQLDELHQIASVRL